MDLHQIDVETFIGSVRPREAERSIVTRRAHAKNAALLDGIQTRLLRISARRGKCDAKQQH
jgi:hypothetical protein